jgi:hypothetical protein
MTMSQRESQLLWLKDVIGHLRESQEQLEWTDDPESARLLLERMMQDLECSKRLCAELRMRTPIRLASLARSA